MLSIDHNQIMVEHYKEVTLVSEDVIELFMNSYKLKIVGEHLHVVALEKNEIHLTGMIHTLTFEYEK